MAGKLDPTSHPPCVRLLVTLDPSFKWDSASGEGCTAASLPSEATFRDHYQPLRMRGRGPPRPREAGPESAAEVGRKLALCSPIGKRNRELRAHEIPNHISCSEIPPAGGFIGVGAENHVTPKVNTATCFFPALRKTVVPHCIFIKQLFDQRVRCAEHCEDTMDARL